MKRIVLAVSLLAIPFVAIADNSHLVDAEDYHQALMAKAEAQVEQAKTQKRLVEAERQTECTGKIRSLENELMYLKGRLEGIEYMLKKQEEPQQ